MTRKIDIESALLEELTNRFSQSKNTPFLQPPLLQEVGQMGFGPAREKILDGTYTTPQGTDPWAACLITQLARAQGNTVPPSTELNINEHISGWKKAREYTSSGLSDIHFGHFIAGTKDP